MKNFTRRELCALLAGGAGAVTLQNDFPVSAGINSVIEKSPGEKIKAFCIDFNWAPTNGFAPPGMYTKASAKEHFSWYRDLGVNTIQTFCVSCCGHAWYRSAVPPVNPGMKGDFLKEITALGHNAGMRVMGYLCIGANTYWGTTYPELSHGTPAKWHIPLTLKYLDYLSRSIEDVLTKVSIDGFMVDWLWSVEPTWLACEREMYKELFGEKFPGRDKVNEE